MPVDYVIDHARRLVLTTGQERVTFSEISGLQDRLSRDPSFDPTFNQLVDTTGVTELDVSASQALAIADRGVFSRESLRVFIVTRPAVSGLGLLMQMYQEKHAAVQVFYDRDSALTWLGLVSNYRIGAC